MKEERNSEISNSQFKPQCLGLLPFKTPLTWEKLHLSSHRLPFILSSVGTHRPSLNIFPEHAAQLPRQYGRQSSKILTLYATILKWEKKYNKETTPTTKFAQLLPGHTSAFTDFQWQVVPRAYNGKTYNARQSLTPHLHNVSHPHIQSYIIKAFSLESWS